MSSKKLCEDYNQNKILRIFKQVIKNNNNYYEYLSISIITLIIFYFFIGKNTGSIAQGDPSNYQLFSRYYFDNIFFRGLQRFKIQILDMFNNFLYNIKNFEFYNRR